MIQEKISLGIDSMIIRARTSSFLGVRTIIALLIKANPFPKQRFVLNFRRQIIMVFVIFRSKS